MWRILTYRIWSGLGRRAWRAWLLGAVVGLWSGAMTRGVEPAARLFQEGIQRYVAGDYTNAAASFREAALQSQGAGAWYNLGNAEWRSGRVGPAVLAWERARWIDPFHAPARANLDFARKTASLEHPELAWYEICSTWLPTPWWGWLAAGCFWGSASLLILPGALRWGRSEWHQGLASAGFAAFLLVLPALAGVWARSQWGVVVGSPTPLRLAPAEHGQFIGKLNPGEAVRRESRREGYDYLHAGNEIAGWVKTGEVGWIAEAP